MITSKEIEHNYIEIGYNKWNMNIAKCFILAILAGMFIAFGGLSSSVASCMIEKFVACKADSKCCLSGRPCNGCRSRR